MFATISVKEAAILWGITERRVSTLYKSGKTKGAKKVGHNWMIPKGTEKPADGRIKSGNYISAVRETLSTILGHASVDVTLDIYSQTKPIRIFRCCSRLLSISVFLLTN